MFSRSLLRPLRITVNGGSASRWQRATASRAHTTASYAKEVDSSPAADPKIHRVDPSSENVQKPHEAPSGKWSATGVEAGVKNAQGKGTSPSSQSEEGEKKTAEKKVQ
ncbi:hypothetical protein C8R46DRAFT_1046907 [Mycena filopes]|nr:hypothetical protein C8R46DRAFT_1046907 [Mycena filopes]